MTEEHDGFDAMQAAMYVKPQISTLRAWELLIGGLAVLTGCLYLGAYLVLGIQHLAGAIHG